MNSIPFPGAEIPFEGGINFRELGGYRVKDGRTVRPGCFYRGMNTTGLTGEADRAKLDSFGLRAIFDLRSSGEIATAPDLVLEGARLVTCCALCAEDGHEIDFSPDDIALLHSKVPAGALESGDPYAFMYGMYAMMLTGNRAYRNIFRAMEEGEAPLLFHCTAGKDRTGVAAMLILMALGADDETMLDDYEYTNVCRRPLIEALIAKKADEIAANPAEEHRLRTVYGVAREVGAFVLQSIRSSFGSYEAYLEAEYGLDAARLNALRDKYLISGIPD